MRRRLHRRPLRLTDDRGLFVRIRRIENDQVLFLDELLGLLRRGAWSDVLMRNSIGQHIRLAPCGAVARCIKVRIATPPPRPLRTPAPRNERGGKHSSQSSDPRPRSTIARERIGGMDRRSHDTLGGGIRRSFRGRNRRDVCNRGACLGRAFAKCIDHSIHAQRETIEHAAKPAAQLLVGNLLPLDPRLELANAGLACVLRTTGQRQDQQRQARCCCLPAKSSHRNRVHSDRCAIKTEAAHGCGTLVAERGISCMRPSLPMRRRCGHAIKC